MTRETYRWREEPDIIARFVHDKELPKNTPIVLRPNEVCVVLEDGRISGIVTQQVMRANPTTSMLRRVFGGKRQRSYLFAFLGPYTFTMPFASKSSDHQTMKGEASLRVHASRENIARLIQLPAKGIMEIRTSDISNLLIDEAQAYMSKTIQRFTNDELVQDQADENTTIGLCMALRRTVESFGMTIDHAYITWKPSDKIRLEAEREHVTNMAEHASIQAERDQITLDAQLSHHQRRADHHARSQAMNASAMERAKVEPELARIKANGAVDEADWQNKRRALEHELHQRRVDATSKAEVLDILRSKELDLRERKQQNDLDVAMQLFDAVQKKKLQRQQQKYDAIVKISSSITTTE
ncbi:MAG: hypothetical protein CMB10_03755 [Euryarchaeota archaeon]|nr:hypothetical protein [Euryarchaeota archaeon]|tara:strand:- start:1205 stop:2269 length:1065 start_codon:yes stop_codon:yes gene_type:complete